MHDGLYFNFPVVCITMRCVSVLPAAFKPKMFVDNKPGSTPSPKSVLTKKTEHHKPRDRQIYRRTQSVHFISILLSIVTQIDVCEPQTD